MSDELPDRRKEDRRFAGLDRRIDGLAAKLDENTAATLCVQKNTADIVEAWKALSGGLKVLGWLGTVAKYVAYFAGAISAAGGAWYALTHWGQPPK